jgi:hypothetical protein
VSAEGYKVEKTDKMTSIRLAKTIEKRLRPSGHRSVELWFGFCFQQNVYPGVCRWLRDAGSGTQKDRVIW